MAAKKAPGQRRVVPLLLTCDRRLHTFRTFVASVKRVLPALARPIVVIDTSASPRLSTKYLELVASLRPGATYVHHRQTSPGDVYGSVQHAAQFALERVREETVPGDLVLFLEDDIVFSSRFREVLRSCVVPDDAGFVTFYAPAGEYGGTLVDPERFYGTQCLLLPRRSVCALVDAYDVIEATLQNGYDIRWSRFLARQGYRLYATERSYVQHLDHAASLLNGGTRPGHRSSNFVP
jgi:hypothetical protein